MNKITEYLEFRLKKELPGLEAHRQMASYVRITAKDALEKKLKVKLSAVLILLYPENNNIYTVLMQRPKSNGVHSAQMAFPGGRKEPEDINLGFTALREAEEEIGIDAKKITLLGSLTHIYIPPSNYIVAPYIGYSNVKPAFVPNPREVDELVHAPIKLLLDKKNIKKTIIGTGKNQNMQLEVPYFDVYGKIVWGATAMMIGEFCALMEDNFFN